MPNIKDSKSSRNSALCIALDMLKLKLQRYLMLRTERLLSSLATIEDDGINELEVDLKNKQGWKGLKARKKSTTWTIFKTD